MSVLLKEYCVLERVQCINEFRNQIVCPCPKKLLRVIRTVDNNDLYLYTTFRSIGGNIFGGIQTKRFFHESRNIFKKYDNTYNIKHLDEYFTKH